MSSFAADRGLGGRIDSLRLNMEDRLLREAAARAKWSFGRRVACRVSPSSPAALARSFRLPDAIGPDDDGERDELLARLAAAWEPPGDGYKFAPRP